MAGAGFIVVAVPSIVVRTGVTVEGFPLASTDTHGSRADSVAIGKVRNVRKRVLWGNWQKTYQPVGQQDLRVRRRTREQQQTSCFSPLTRASQEVFD